MLVEPPFPKAPPDGILITPITTTLQALIVYFFFSTEKSSTVCKYHNIFIHSPTEGHIYCFQVLTIGTAINICVEGFV